MMRNEVSQLNIGSQVKQFIHNLKINDSQSHHLLNEYLKELMGAPNAKLNQEQREKIHKVISADPVVQDYFKQTKNFMDTPADIFRKSLFEYKETQRHQTIAHFNVGLQFITQLGAQLGNKDAYRVGMLAQSALQIYSGVSQLLAGATPGLMAAGPIGIIGIGALTIFTLFSKNKSQQDLFPQILMEHLQAISVQIHNLHREMHESFRRVFENQQLIYETVCQGFDDLARLIQSGFRDHHFSMTSAIDSLQAIANRTYRLLKFGLESILLDKLKLTLNEIDEIERQIEVESFEGELKLDPKKKELEYLHQHLFDWLKFKGFSAHPIHSGAVLTQGYKEGNPDEWTCKILQDFSDDALADLTGYLAHYAEAKDCLDAPLFVEPEVVGTPREVKTQESKRVVTSGLDQKTENIQTLSLSTQEVKATESPQVRVDVDALFNPTIWGPVAIRYIQFRSDLLKRGMNLDKYHKYMDEITLAGANYLSFVRSLQTNRRLYAKLFENYKNTLADIDQIINDAIAKKNLDIREQMKVRFVKKTRSQPDEKEVKSEINICAPQDSIAAYNAKDPLAVTISGVEYEGSFLFNQWGKYSINGINFSYHDLKQILIQKDATIPMEFILLERLGLVEFGFIYDVKLTSIGASTIGHFDIKLQRHLENSDPKTVFNIKFNIPLQNPNCGWDGPTTDLAGHQIQRGNLNFSAIIQNYWGRKKFNTAEINVQLRRESHDQLMKYFVEARKDAIKVCDKIPLNKALLKLEASLRLLKAYARVSGFRENEIQLLSRLYDSNRVKANLHDYTQNAVLDTPLPLFSDLLFGDIQEAERSFMSKLSDASYFQNNYQTMVKYLIGQLNMLKVVPDCLDLACPREEKSDTQITYDADEKLRPLAEKCMTMLPPVVSTMMDNLKDLFQHYLDNQLLWQRNYVDQSAIDHKDQEAKNIYDNLQYRIAEQKQLIAVINKIFLSLHPDPLNIIKNLKKLNELSRNIHNYYIFLKTNHIGNYPYDSNAFPFLSEDYKILLKFEKRFAANAKVSFLQQEQSPNGLAKNELKENSPGLRFNVGRQTNSSLLFSSSGITNVSTVPKDSVVLGV